MRYLQGIEFFEPNNVMNFVKRWQKASLRERVKNDPVFATSVDDDNTGITWLLYLGFALKVLQSFVMFISYSYVIGMLFYIASLQAHRTTAAKSIDEDLGLDDDEADLPPLEEDVDEGSRMEEVD